MGFRSLTLARNGGYACPRVECLDYPGSSWRRCNVALHGGVWQSYLLAGQQNFRRKETTEETGGDRGEFSFGES